MSGIVNEGIRFWHHLQKIIEDTFPRNFSGLIDQQKLCANSQFTSH